MPIDALVSLIEMLRGESRYNKEAKKEALFAINRAIVATRTYEALVVSESEILESDKRNREEEIRIGGLWQEAAIKTRDVSSEFSSILHSKSLYWMTDFRYSAEAVLAKRIDWDSIDDLTLALLQE